jgi:hypothetical protein
MPLGSREYVSSKPLADLAACQREMGRLGELLRARRAASDLKGFWVQVFETAEEIEEDGLAPQRIVPAAGDRFPLVFINITWTGTDDAPAWLAPFERENALRPLG